MVDWWKAAPLVEQSGGDDWWKNAPLVEQGQAKSQADVSGWSPSAEADAVERIAGTGTFADMTGSGMSRGIPFADEIASGVNAPFRAAREWFQGDGFDIARSYDRNMQVEAELQKRREERSPIASTVGTVAGGIGATAPLAAGGFSLLNGARPTLASMTGRAATEGVGYGLAYGAGEGRGLDERLRNAAWGGVGGGATGAAVGGLGRVGARFVDTSALPTADDLKKAAQAAYQRADDAGVVYSKDAVNRIKNALTGEFTEFGFHPELQGGAKVALGEVARLADNNVTLKGLDTARKIAGNAFQPGNKPNNALTAKVTEAIDDLVENPRAGDIIMGDGAAAGKAITEARSLYRQGAKLDTLNGLLERAGRRAARAGSGGNIENATRQELSKILDNPKLRRGYTAEELDAVRRAVMGTKGQNLLRWAGKLSPEGNGLMAAIHGMGGWASSGATLPLAAVGMAAKRGSEAMSANAAKIAEAVIAGGKMPEATISPLRQAIIEALTRGSALSLPANTVR